MEATVSGKDLHNIFQSLERPLCQFFINSKRQRSYGVRRTPSGTKIIRVASRAQHHTVYHGYRDTPEPVSLQRIVPFILLDCPNEEWFRIRNQYFHPRPSDIHEARASRRSVTCKLTRPLRSDAMPEAARDSKAAIRSWQERLRLPCLGTSAREFWTTNGTFTYRHTITTRIITYGAADLQHIGHL
jgi:hypothetical protein